MQPRAADSYHPLAVTFAVAPADDAAEQLTIERLQLGNQLFCRLMREAAQRWRRVQQAGQRQGVLVFTRVTFYRRRQMPQRRGGDELRGSRHGQMMAARFQNGFHRLRYQVVLVTVFFGGQQLSARFAIQHIVRLTARRARQRQRAKVRALFAQQQFRAGAQQHAAVFQRYVEVKASRVLGDKTLHQRAAINLFVGGDINQARQYHLIHLRRGGERRSAGDHLLENRLRRDLGALLHIQRLRAGGVACGLLTRRAGEGLPALRNKQR